MKPSHIALVFALLSSLGTSSADTILGGRVDYLPHCYEKGDALMFIEYDSGACRFVVPSNKQNCPCNVPNFNTDESSPYLTKVDDRCVYVTKIDEYTVESNTALSAVSVENPKYSQFYAGYFNSKAPNSPVLQAININGESTHVTISLFKGLKMVRFRYLTAGQRQDWYQGVQLRFTEDFMQRLVARDVGTMKYTGVEWYSDLGMYSKYSVLMIDLKCFYLTAIIPFDRREDGHQMIDCVRLTDKWDSSVGTQFSDIPWDGTITNAASAHNCEQGSNVQDVAAVVPRSLESVVMETLKNVAMAGVSFIPVIGPFLAVGLDVGYNVLVTYQDNPAGLDAFLKNEGVTGASVSGAVILEQLKDALLKRITRLKLR